MQPLTWQDFGDKCFNDIKICDYQLNTTGKTVETMPSEEQYKKWMMFCGFFLAGMVVAEAIQKKVNDKERCIMLGAFWLNIYDTGFYEVQENQRVMIRWPALMFWQTIERWPILEAQIQCAVVVLWNIDRISLYSIRKEI